MPEQQINAGAKPAAEGLCLPPGRILQQVAGTIRPLTSAEARAFRGWQL